MANNPAPEPQPNEQMQRLFMWVKGVEGKVNNLLREVDLLKNDFIGKTNSLKKDMKSLNQDLLEMKREQEKNVQKMDLIIKELKQTAGIEELQTLKRYIEYFNPMSFVTQRDLERSVEAKLGATKAINTKAHSKG